MNNIYVYNIFYINMYTASTIINYYSIELLRYKIEEKGVPAELLQTLKKSRKLHIKKIEQCAKTAVKQATSLKKC